MTRIGLYVHDFDEMVKTAKIRDIERQESGFSMRDHSRDDVRIVDLTPGYIDLSAQLDEISCNCPVLVQDLVIPRHHPRVVQRYMPWNRLGPVLVAGNGRQVFANDLATDSHGFCAVDGGV